MNTAWGWYILGALITYSIAFLAYWGYATATYGLLGLGLGWIPAPFIAAPLAAVWPLLLFITVFGCVAFG
jgi:hypothetical protein